MADGCAPVAPTRWNSGGPSWRLPNVPNELAARLATEMLTSFSTSAGPSVSDAGPAGDDTLRGARSDPNGVPDMNETSLELSLATATSPHPYVSTYGPATRPAGPSWAR